jgi:hypothetical protein
MEANKADGKTGYTSFCRDLSKLKHVPRPEKLEI